MLFMLLYSKMRFVNVVGLGSSGSSAVSDFLCEFAGVFKPNGEIRFIQDTDGLDDLCNNLVDRWGWHNCDSAIKRFINYTNILARPAPRFAHGENLDEDYNGKFIFLRDRFINQINPITFMGNHPWQDINERSKINVLVERLKKIFYFKFYGTSESIRWATLKKETFFTSPSQDIYKYAQSFLEDLFFPLAVKSLSVYPEYVLLDQGIRAHNIERYNKLFRDHKTIIVDRDPRDVYLDSLTYNAYPGKSDVRDFITWYEAQRTHSPLTSAQDSKILKINFEDLVINYEFETKKIMKFLDLNESSWISKRKIFDPSVSIKNIKMWEKNEFKIKAEQINKILIQLNDACYKHLRE